MYNYEQLTEYLMPHIIDNLVCIFRNGSQLFCRNCKDYDYTIITRVETGIGCFHINDLNVDCFVMSVETLKQKLKDDQWRYKLSVCLAKTNSGNIIYGELPTLDIDILSREYLLKILKIEYAFAQKTYFIGKGAGKTIVWGMALYYALSNGSVTFTNEQLDKMQYYHDNPIDNEFLAQLKSAMENLLQGA